MMILYDDARMKLTVIPALEPPMRESYLPPPPNADPTFITVGFHNWKDDCVKFPKHEFSKSHVEATKLVFAIPNSTPIICEIISTEHAREQSKNRKNFLKILQM